MVTRPTALSYEPQPLSTPSFMFQCVHLNWLWMMLTLSIMCRCEVILLYHPLYNQTAGQHNNLNGSMIFFSERFDPLILLLKGQWIIQLLYLELLNFCAQRVIACGLKQGGCFVSVFIGTHLELVHGQWITIWFIISQWKHPGGILGRRARALIHNCAMKHI